MFAFLAVFLIVCWLLGFVVFHVSAFAIHLLIVVAIVFLVLHLFGGRRAR